MEGSIILARLPAKSEAETIRAVLGIPKRVELSDGQLANLKAHATANAFKPVLPASGMPDGGRRHDEAHRSTFAARL